MTYNLAIVLLNWKEEERTISLLKKLRTWNQISPLVIAVDNESSTHSQKKLKAAIQSEILISSVKNEGFAGGNNLGILRALKKKLNIFFYLIRILNWRNKLSSP